MSKPVVATKTTGSQEIVLDGQTGFLVPINDAEKFTQQLQKILANPALARKLGANASKLVKEKFNREKNIKQIVNAWEKIAI